VEICVNEGLRRRYVRDLIADLGQVGGAIGGTPGLGAGVGALVGGVGGGYKEIETENRGERIVKNCMRSRGLTVLS